MGGDKTSFRLEHVSHARESAAHAVVAATAGKPGPYKTIPYFYSRVFEYTDKPLAFHIYGEQKGNHAEFQAPDGATSEVWVDQGRVVGALVFGSPAPSKADMDFAKAAVADRKKAKSADDAASQLGVGIA